MDEHRAGARSPARTGFVHVSSVVGQGTNAYAIPAVIRNPFGMQVSDSA
jgi:hypothetical protein